MCVFLLQKHREEYITENHSSQYSRVLEVRRYLKDNPGKGNKDKDSRSSADAEVTKYVYGNGLISHIGEEGCRYYHYNHLGSTTKLTDEEGKITDRYTYGTYGELLSKNAGSTIFLYNGQYGVVTDQNGLYYMRARYYNTDIKRFINQDIITGSIQNSQSLNRYAYVQGNPILYTDPFGLSPQSNVVSSFGHTLLDLAGMIPVVGAVFDVANAVWYAREGHPWLAALSVASALPVAGELVGATKTTINMGRLSVSTVKIGKVLKVAGYSGIFAGGAYNTIETGTTMYREYVVEKHKFGWNTVVEAATLTLGVVTMGTSGYAIKNTISSPKSIAVDQPLKEGNTAKERLLDEAEIKKPDPANETAAAKQGEGSATKANKTADAEGTGKLSMAGGCFTAGTKVKTSEGDRNIEEIKAGDEVYSCNVETGETGFKKVEEAYVKYSAELAYVTVAGETIEATANHPFYVEGYGFKPAGDLSVGEEVRLSDGSKQKIESVILKHLTTPIEVYNLKIEDWHTYYVAESGVLVHNVNAKGGCGVEASNTGTLKVDKASDVSDVAKEAEKVKATEVGDGVGGKSGIKTVNGYVAKVNVGQQNKHIPGTNEYKNALNNGQIKSIMYGDINDIQNLLNDKAGTGNFFGTNKERVDFGKVIGQYVDLDTGMGVETTIGIIHYGKKGAHIVPARPN